MADARERRLPVWGWWIIVGAVHVAVFGPLAFRAEYRRDEFVGPNLFRAHTIFTGFVFDDWWRPATPGYLWQVTARSFTELLRSTDLRLGGVIATCCFYALFGIAIFEVFRRVTLPIRPLAPAWAAVASVVIALLESPAAIGGWSAFQEGRIFLPLYLPYAPTTIGSLGLNVLLLLLVSELIEGRLPRRRWWSVALIVVLATIAKPTMAPLLVAVVLGYAAIAGVSHRPRLGLEDDGGGDRASWADLLRLVVLPAIIILIPQYLVTASKVQYPGTAYDDRGGWTIHPFAELRDLNGLTVLFWLALLFPIVAMVVARREMWRDAAIRVALLAAGIGLVGTVLLERTGSVWKGDMLQLPEAAIGLLLVFMPRRALDLRRAGLLGAAATVALLVALAPYVVAGTMSWSCHVGLGCPTG